MRSTDHRLDHDADSPNEAFVGARERPREAFDFRPNGFPRPARLNLAKQQLVWRDPQDADELYERRHAGQHLTPLQAAVHLGGDVHFLRDIRLSQSESLASGTRAGTNLTGQVFHPLR